MIIDYSEVEVEDFFKLPIEDRKRVIELGVDTLFQQVILTAQITEQLPSQLLNNTLATIEENIQYHKDNDNFELCYYFTEVFWEANKRLDEIRKAKGNVFL